MLITVTSIVLALPGFAVGYPEVEVDTGNKHVGLEAYLMDTGWGERHSDGNNPEQRWRRLAVVREGVLRP